MSSFDVYENATAVKVVKAANGPESIRS